MSGAVKKSMELILNFLELQHWHVRRFSGRTGRLWRPQWQVMFVTKNHIREDCCSSVHVTMEKLG